MAKGGEVVPVPDETGVRFIAPLNALLGVAILVSGHLVASPPMAWNASIVGVVVLVLALRNAWVAVHREPHRVVGAAAVNLLLGSWLAASPFVLPVSSFAVLWASVVLGLLVAVLAAYNAWAGERERARRPFAA